MEDKKLFEEESKSGMVEFEFQMKIAYQKQNEEDSERKGYEIRRDMSKYINEYLSFPFRERHLNKEDIYSNAPQRFINYAFTKHFRFSGNGKAYLSDYKEKEGSLIITFTIVIVGSFLNYGGIRETIDYFADDLEKVCEMSMGSRYKINVNHKEKRKKLNRKQRKITSANSLDNNLLEIIQRKITVNRIMIGGAIFFLLLLFAINIIQEPSISGSNEESIENLIDNKIEQSQRNQKIDKLLNEDAQDYQVGDTIIIGIVK